LETIEVKDQENRIEGTIISKKNTNEEIVMKSEGKPLYGNNIDLLITKKNCKERKSTSTLSRKTRILISSLSRKKMEYSSIFMD